MVVATPSLFARSPLAIAARHGIPQGVTHERHALQRADRHHQRGRTSGPASELTILVEVLEGAAPALLELLPTSAASVTSVPFDPVSLSIGEPRITTTGDGQTVFLFDFDLQIASPRRAQEVEIVVDIDDGEVRIEEADRLLEDVTGGQAGSFSVVMDHGFERADLRVTASTGFNSPTVELELIETSSGTGNRSGLRELGALAGAALLAGVPSYDTDAWIDIACELAGRNLTAEEWSRVGPQSVDHRATCPEYPLVNS